MSPGLYAHKCVVDLKLYECCEELHRQKPSPIRVDEDK
jgi:hypothetical protein